LQVTDEDLSLYEGRFDTGYDVYREQRFDALKQAGVTFCAGAATTQPACAALGGFE